MSLEVRLYAGTEDGLFVWQSQNGGWTEVQRGVAAGYFWRLAGCAHRPDRVFAAVDHAGLYRTDDAGEHWTRVLDHDVRAVAVDPTDDNVVYAGTEPVHLYRSEDGGRGWEEMTSLTEVPEEVRQQWGGPTDPHVLSILIDPRDSRALHLCIEQGGVLRSLDAGNTWEDVSRGISFLDMHMVAMAPAGPSPQYFVSSADGFFTSQDPAQGWRHAQQGVTRDYFHDFLILPPASVGEPPSILAATADATPNRWSRPGRARAAVFRSDDLGESWRQVGEGLPESMETAIWAFARHPGDPCTAFMGVGAYRQRSERDAGPGEGRILVTRDRGACWDELPLEVPAVRALWAAPV